MTATDSYERMTIKGKDLVVYLDDKGKVTAVCGWRTYNGGLSRNLYDLWTPTRGEPRGLAKEAINRLQGPTTGNPSQTSDPHSPP
jgi:hypothetical protein